MSNSSFRPSFSLQYFYFFFLSHRTERQWRDLAFCLSMLSYNERGIRKLQENFTCFHDKLAEEDVYQSFLTIVGKSKKFAKPEVKVISSLRVGPLPDRLINLGEDYSDSLLGITRWGPPRSLGGQRITGNNTPRGSGEQRITGNNTVLSWGVMKFS